MWFGYISVSLRVKSRKTPELKLLSVHVQPLSATIIHPQLFYLCLVFSSSTSESCRPGSLLAPPPLLAFHLLSSLFSSTLLQSFIAASFHQDGLSFLFSICLFHSSPLSSSSTYNFFSTSSFCFTSSFPFLLHPLVLLIFLLHFVLHLSRSVFTPSVDCSGWRSQLFVLIWSFRFRSHDYLLAKNFRGNSQTVVIPPWCIFAHDHIYTMKRSSGIWLDARRELDCRQQKPLIHSAFPISDSRWRDYFTFFSCLLFLVYIYLDFNSSGSPLGWFLLNVAG